MRHALAFGLLLSGCTGRTPYPSNIGSSHYSARSASADESDAQSQDTDATSRPRHRVRPDSEKTQLIPWPPAEGQRRASSHGPNRWYEVRLPREFGPTYAVWSRGAQAPEGTLIAVALAASPDADFDALWTMVKKDGVWRFEVWPTDGNSADSTPLRSSENTRTTTLCHQCHSQATSDYVFGPGSSNGAER